MFPGDLLILKSFKNLKFHKCGFVRYLYALSRKIYVFFRIILDSKLRKQAYWRIIYNRKFHQISHFTEVNRYPDLFEICRNHCENITVPRILSFGCSTGEEVFSLGMILTTAKIIGTDISYWCLRQCQKRNSTDRFTFIHPLSVDFKMDIDFDVILCLAVFQHPENRLPETQKARKYKFLQFEQQLFELDHKLKKGGLLIFDNCDFDFRESIIFTKYSVLEVENNIIERQRPLFNRNNERIAETTIIPRVYRKEV